MILLIGIGLAVFVMPDWLKIPTVIAFAFLEFAETMLTWRWSRRDRAKVGPGALIGATGRAITECRPEGMVRVHGEDWRARCEAGVEPGERIRVLALDQLILTVEPLYARATAAESPAPGDGG